MKISGVYKITNTVTNDFYIGSSKNVKQKKYQKEYQKEYHKSEKRKKTMKEYNQSDKGKEVHRKATYKYNNQLCFYSGETLTLAALRCRFIKMGIEHPTKEAKKYLLDKDL